MKGFYILILFAFAFSGVTMLSFVGNPSRPSPSTFSMPNFHGRMDMVVGAQDSIIQIIRGKIEQAHLSSLETLELTKQIRDKRKRPARRTLPEAKDAQTCPVKFTAKGLE